MLHDWPEAETGQMLDRAAAILPPGGRIVICERGPLENEIGSGGRTGTMPFSMAANLVFSPFYRPPEFYQAELQRRGFENPLLRQTKVEMAFNVVIAKKAGMTLKANNEETKSGLSTSANTVLP